MTDAELIQRLREMAEQHCQELGAPATEEQLADAEQLLGYPLPPFLRRLYAELGNGGIGPGADWRQCWLMGVRGGIGNDFDDTAVNEYVARRNEQIWLDPDFIWPEGLLPIAPHGCAIYTCVDCTSPKGDLIEFSVKYHDGRVAAESFVARRLTIREWLESWLPQRADTEIIAEPGVVSDQDHG